MRGSILSAKEILEKLKPGYKVPVVKKENGLFYVFGEQRDPKLPYEADILKKNLTGAKKTHGENAFIFPG